MFLIIKDNHTFQKYKLSDYLLYKGIEIYLKDDNYYINLKDDYYFSDNTKNCLLELKKYLIYVKDVYYCIELYAYQLDIGIDDFKLYENQKVLIANDEKANVISKDYYLKDYYLYLDNGYLKTNYEISVNNSLYNGTKLNSGDIVEYLGIKIFYYDDYLYINNFNVDINLKEYSQTEKIIKYQELEISNSYYILNDLVDLVIDPLDKFEPPKKNKASEFVRTIIPNLIMSLSTAGLASVSLYSSIINNQPGYTRISYILMPISMFITGIVVPITFYLYEAHKYKKSYKNIKNDYLSYLKEYEINLDNVINNYLNSYNSRFFDVSNIKEKMFYATNKNNEFLTLSLGNMSISKDLTYSITNDKEIDDFLMRLKLKVNNIHNYPLFLDLKDNPVVSIITKRGDKQYFFNRFLLELAYKHHYNDIFIAVYSKNNHIFDLFYNLPHLFLNNIRLTLNSDKQLQELDQTKLDKPLVLFINDPIDFYFTNKNIYVIYMSIDINDVYKDSDCIVEYLNNKAYLYKNTKTEFNYVLNDISFNEYFSYLGRFRKNRDENNELHFKDILSTNIKENYLNQNNTLTSCFAFSNSELLNFDLHESKQGPHGLIGGSTGSGKSELIISLLLSLCIRYSPEYLNIVLIDYKGAGIKDSLSYKNIALPHIVADVSNLENNVLQRLIICLKNECKYRQELFKQLTRLSNVSIMNLDDYLANGYKNFGLCGLAHLLIVVDEFAQLKKENPEEIKELISISRIGRSLGLHLILATQKPNGVIDEEIWSNSHFKIALKVFDEKDSMDIIKRKDAAYLSKAGCFLLQVDDSLIKAQSIYSKNDIYGNDPYIVKSLDNMLVCNKTYKHQYTKTISEANMYCLKIIEACKSLDIKTRKLDFLPVKIKNRKVLTNSECLVFGESDDYYNSLRSLVAYDIKDSVLLYSTRKNEINSFLNTFNEFNRQCVVIGQNKYRGYCISDSISYDEQEDINYLLDYLLNHKNHNLTLLIEDVNCLLSYDESYLDKLCRLSRRSDNLDLSLLFITTSSQISFKLINYFNNRVLICINDKTDISAFYGSRSKYDGNSFYYDNEAISLIPVMIEPYVESNPKLEPIIKRIPEAISPLIENDKYLLGYDAYTKEKVFSNDQITIISLDETLLNRYASYGNMQKVLYKHNIKINNENNILWLGPGIFNQRLFIASNKDDLSAEEGLFIKKGAKQVLRLLNDE